MKGRHGHGTWGFECAHGLVGGSLNWHQRLVGRLPIEILGQMAEDPFLQFPCLPFPLSSPPPKPRGFSSERAVGPLKSQPHSPVDFHSLRSLSTSLLKLLPPLWFLWFCASSEVQSMWFLHTNRWSVVLLCQAEALLLNYGDQKERNKEPLRLLWDGHYQQSLF